jgi:hypothetical protein
MLQKDGIQKASALRHFATKKSATNQEKICHKSSVPTPTLRITHRTW